MSAGFFPLLNVTFTSIHLLYYITHIISYHSIPVLICFHIFHLLHSLFSLLSFDSGRCVTGCTLSWPWTLQCCSVTLVCLCFRTWWHQLQGIMWEWFCPLSSLLQTEDCFRTCCPRWQIWGFRSVCFTVVRSATAWNIWYYLTNNCNWDQAVRPLFPKQKSLWLNISPHRDHAVFNFCVFKKKQKNPKKLENPNFSIFKFLIPV